MIQVESGDDSAQPLFDFQFLSLSAGAAQVPTQEPAEEPAEAPAQIVGMLKKLKDANNPGKKEKMETEGWTRSRKKWALI